MHRVHRRLWQLVLIVVVGAALGLAIAGVPSRQKDHPLGVESGSVASTTTTILSPSTTSSSTSTAPTTSMAPPATSSTLPHR